MKRNHTQNSGKAIVLVHGGFVDGSGWAGVYRILKEKGYNVVVVQNPTKYLADDVAFTKSAIDSVKSDVVLVGHSYGGVVITEAGTTQPADSKRRCCNQGAFEKPSGWFQV
jgi:pimeloyl-ACP methyl ester carboxylesterase